jgi:DNA-binding GntR family transcriptional regulator
LRPPTSSVQSPPLFTAFRVRPNVRVEIRETLRGAVISGTLRPGGIYSAPSLADEFGVSVTPVREALLDLVREGHMEAVRMVASTGADPAVIDRLLELAESIVEAAHRQDLIAYVTADTEFHLAIIAVTGDPELVELLRSLRAKSRIYGLQRLAEAGRLLSSSPRTCGAGQADRGA